MNTVNEALRHKKTLITAHRGSYRASIPANTLDAFDIALRQGADIIETDVQRCADGSLFLFHSGMERVFLGDADIRLDTKTAEEVSRLSLVSENQLPTPYRLPGLDEALEHLKGRCMINLDRCEDFWEEVIEVVDRHRMADQIILKSAPDPKYFERAKGFARRIMYMPVVSNCDRASELLTAMQIPFAGLELVFADESSPLCSPEYIEAQHRANRFLWVNSLIIYRDTTICARHDDAVSMTQSPDDGWGWLVDRGFDIIQTDWTAELRAYLDRRGKRDDRQQTAEKDLMK